MNNFNKKEIYEQEIAEKLNDVVKLCNYYGIPFFATACVANDNKNTEYVSDMISPDVLNLELKDNRFPRYVNVGLGFDTVPADTIIEIEY